MPKLGRNIKNPVEQTCEIQMSVTTMILPGIKEFLFFPETVTHHLTGLPSANNNKVSSMQNIKGLRKLTCPDALDKVKSSNNLFLHLYPKNREWSVK